MDLRRLELLMHVATFGSFSKSAAVLGIAQPALGRQIQKLEEACGTRLLYRHGRGVSLTPEGEQLIARARPLVRQLEAIATDLRHGREEPKGTVILGLTPTVCDLIGLRLLTALSEKYPHITVNVVSGYSGYIHEWLVDARLDIAVLHDARRSATVAVDPVGIARLALVTPPGMKIGNRVRRNITIRELQGIPLALPGRNHGLRRTLEFAAGQAGIALDVRYEVDALRLAMDLVKGGKAATVLARPAYKPALDAGQVAEVRIDEPTVETRLMVAEASNRPVTQAMRYVRQEIKTILAQLAQTSGPEYGLVPLT